MSNEEKKYIADFYFQKSSSFLYPLTGVLRNKKYDPKTYLYWMEENIEDFKLIVLYEVDINDENFKSYEAKFIINNERIVNCYIVEEGIVYIFDLCSTWANDVAWFLEGKYSKFSEGAKRMIKRYFNIINNEVKPGKPISVSLEPQRFWQQVAKELDVSLEDLQDTYELTPPFSKEKETFHGKIITDCNCVQKENLYYIK